MLGLPRGEVFLVPWTEKWHEEFLQEKQRIEKQIGEFIIAIHHIGSTAVPYLSAKPIIDIAIEVDNERDGYKCITPLEQIDYRFRENVLPERFYFNKGEPRTHQIHLYEKGNRYLQRQLHFRDYLRENDAIRKQYEKLKYELVEKNSNNKHAYAEEKTEFIMRVLGKIASEEGS